MDIFVRVFESRNGDIAVKNVDKNQGTLTTIACPSRSG